MKSVNQGYNKYCVPAVLSILTGRSTDDCASVIGSISDKDWKDVTTVPIEVMKKAAVKLRFNLIEVEGTIDCSIFWALQKLYSKPGLYVVFVKRHVIAIEVEHNGKIMICDNHTKEPITAGASARLGQRCLGIWKAEPKPPAILIAEQYEVEVTDRATYISKLSIFEDLEDNIKRSVGSLYGSPSDVKAIVLELLDTFDLHLDSDNKIVGSDKY